jgi:hypothetical protein
MRNALGYIFNFIPTRDVPNVSLVCKQWRATISTDYIFDCKVVEDALDKPDVVYHMIKFRSVKEKISKSILWVCCNHKRQNDTLVELIRHRPIDKQNLILSTLMDNGLFGTSPCCDKFCLLWYSLLSGNLESVKRYFQGLTIEPPTDLCVKMLYSSMHSEYRDTRMVATQLFTLINPTKGNWELILEYVSGNSNPRYDMYLILKGACEFGLIWLARLLVDKYKLNGKNWCLLETQFNHLDLACAYGNLELVELLLNNYFRPKDYPLCLASYKGGKVIPTDLIDLFKKCIPNKEEFVEMNGCPMRNSEIFYRNMSRYNFWNNPWSERDTIIFSHLLECCEEDYEQVSRYIYAFFVNLWKEEIVPKKLLEQQRLWTCNVLKSNQLGIHLLNIAVLEKVKAEKLKELLTCGHACSDCMKIDDDLLSSLLNRIGGEWIEKLGILLPLYKTEVFTLGQKMIHECDLFKSLEPKELRKLLEVILKDERFNNDYLLNQIADYLKGRKCDAEYSFHMFLDLIKPRVLPNYSKY